MEAKTLSEKSEKITTLIQVAKEVNNLYFENKEDKSDLIKTTLEKLKIELKDY